MEQYFSIIFVFVIASLLGFELITKVPPTLHTPLMSGSNAISGITVVGAIAFASINVVGGYMVTDRMLGSFKKKEK